MAADRLPDPRAYPPELVHGELCNTRFGVSRPCDCGKESESAPVSAAVSPAEPPERSCVKCGATDISVTWHGAGEDHHTREYSECRKYGRDNGKPAEEHLCCVCRTCQYRWKEDVLDAPA